MLAACLASAAISGATARSSTAVDHCFTDLNHQLACPVPTGLTWVTAVDHSTGLSHGSGYQDVDVINLHRACQAVRLYYLFAFEGTSRTVPPVTVPVRHAAVVRLYRSFSWSIVPPSRMVTRIRTLLAPDNLSYFAPYPDSYWYVYVAHTETERLGIGGVRCLSR
jgi:hypothetical protein